MAVFIPGTTPEWTAKIDVSSADMEKVVQTFVQGKRTVQEKEYTEFTDDEDGNCTFVVSFTQLESLRFVNDVDIYVQCNVLFANTDRFASAVTKLSAWPQLHRKVMKLNESDEDDNSSDGN